MSKSNRYSPEVRERAVRMLHEHRAQFPSLWAAIESLAPKIGCAPKTLNEWIRGSASHGGGTESLAVPEQDRLKALERENKELRGANEILKLASAFLPRRSRAAA